MSTREYLNSTFYYQTNQTYDKAGNLLTIKDAKNQQTTFYYDDLNRLTKATFPDSKNQTATYDAIGNVLTTTDPKSQTILFSYDELQRAKKIAYPNSTTIVYSFDKVGNRLTMNNTVSSNSYVYDARNRLIAETMNIGGTRYTKWFEYDAANRLTKLVYPDGYVLNYQYDSLDKVKSLGSFGNFTYTKDDKIKTLTSGNGILTTYTYDPRGRPTRVLIKDGSTTLQDLNYTYSGNGNTLNINSEGYSYDGLDRLKSSNGPWGNITYTYDGVGNRLTKVEEEVLQTILMELTTDCPRRALQTLRMIIM